MSSTGSRADWCFRGVALLVMESSWPGDGMRCGRVSEADRLSDQDDVNAAGQFPGGSPGSSDLAVLPVGGDRAGVGERRYSS